MARTLDFSWAAAGGIFAAVEAATQGRGTDEVLATAAARLEAARPGDDKEQVEARLLQAWGQLARGRVEEAVAGLRAARRLLQEAGSGQEELQAALLAAAAQAQGGRGEDALRTAEEAQALARQRGDGRGEAAALRILARARLALGRPGQALRDATAAAALSKAAGDAAGQARACAVAARAQGSAAAGQRLAEEALALARSAQDGRGQGEAQEALAEVRLAAGDGAGAAAAAAEAAAVFAQARDGVGRAGSLCLEARCRAAQGDAAAALKVAREALALFRAAGDERGVLLARELCATLRSKPAAGAAAAAAEAAAPGASNPAVTGGDPWVSCTRVVGVAETKQLAGLVAVVTGGSRGIGKGTAQMLAQSGATVYVTGRAAGARPDGPGSAGETAGALAKLGGAGVAVHADHTKADDNQALVDVVAQNHGRLDVLVNSVPVEGCATTADGKPDRSGQSAAFAECLRRGKGLIVDVAGRGGRVGEAEEPAAERLHDGSLRRVALAPGCVKSERSMASAQQVGARLIDLESTRLSGQAVAKLAAKDDAELSHFAGSHRALCSAAAARFELDGYSHEPEVQTFATFARTPLVR